MAFLKNPLRWARALLAAAALTWAGTVPALSSDQDQPIQIEADGVEIDDGRGVSVYTGNVEIQQGSMRLWADQVTLHHSKSHEAQRLIAVGRPARYRQLLDGDHGEVKARALRMEYDAGSEEIVLKEQAELTQGKDRFSSDRIVYDRNKALVKAGASAQGKQRVRITFDPKRRQ
jgi:lipopolysaccharide export system protein LptA